MKRYSHVFVSIIFASAFLASCFTREDGPDTVGTTVQTLSPVSPDLDDWCCPASDCGLYSCGWPNWCLPSGYETCGEFCSQNPEVCGL